MARGTEWMIVDAIYRNWQGRGTTTGNDGEESNVHVAVTAGRLLEGEMGLDLSVGRRKAERRGEGKGSGEKGEKAVNQVWNKARGVDGGGCGGPVAVTTALLRGWIVVAQGQ